MKKTLLLLGAMIAMLFTQSQAVAQTNLLPNGDFEAWTSGKPDKWAGPGNNATLSQSTDAHGGSYAVKVGATASSNKRLASNNLNLLAGTYKVSFWAKGGQVRPGYVIVTNGAIASSGDYKYGDFATLSATEWTKVDYEFTLTATTTVNIVVMNPKSNQNTSPAYTATEAIIDDMTLTTQDGGLGEVEQVTYTDVTLATLAGYKENKANVSLKLTNAKVVYVDGESLYVREGDNAIMFFKTGLDVPVNSLLNGTLKGNFELYNLIPEFKANDDTNPKDVMKTNSSEVAQPVETTVAEILEMKHRADLVVLRGITVVKDGTKYYAADGADRVQFYKGLDMSAYENGKAYDVTGLFNNSYSGAPEIQPTAVVENSSVVVVPAPALTPEGGRYEGSVEVSIEVPEGCNVYYTFDGSNPDDSKTQYTAPFVLTETTTVKAVAYNSDDQTSAVVSATYTIVPVVEGFHVAFNFVENSWNHATSNGDALDAGNILDAITSDVVSMRFIYPEEASSKPRFWQGKDYVDVRIYNGQQILITAPEDRNILQVVFYAAAKGDIKLADNMGQAIEAATIETSSQAPRRAPASSFSKASATLTPDFAIPEVMVKATGTTKLTEVEVILSVPSGIDTTLDGQRSMVNATYDLQGRRVNGQQPKGVYIVGGKKVIR